MCKVPLQALHEIVYDSKYADQNIRRLIANSIERHESTVSRVLSEETRLDQDQAARLGRDLSDKLGEMRWSRCFVGTTAMVIPRTFGRANGIVDDDFAAYVKAGVEWRDSMQKGDPAAARAAMDRCRAALADMEAETKLL